MSRARSLLVGLVASACGPRAVTPPASTLTGPVTTHRALLSRVGDTWQLTPDGAPPGRAEVAEPVVAAMAMLGGPPPPVGHRVLVSALATGKGWVVVDWSCASLPEDGCRPLPEGARWAAHGTEPFWSLVVFATDATWSTPEATTTLQVGPAGSEPPAILLTPGDAGPAWSFTVASEPCSDGMSDAVWAHTATVTDGEAEWQGCAQRGP